MPKQILSWHGGCADMRVAFAEAENGRYVVEPHPLQPETLYRARWEADDVALGAHISRDGAKRACDRDYRLSQVTSESN